MRTSAEHIDAMLFDYLEGNLSIDESKQAEIKIASDPLIHEELTIWKQTYIQADQYPTTTVLESQLLQGTGSFSFTLFLNSILVICLTLVSGTNPKLNTFSTLPIYQSLPALDGIMPSSRIAHSLVNIEPKQIVASAVIVPHQTNQSKEWKKSNQIYQAIPALGKITPERFFYAKRLPESIDVAYVKTTKHPSKTALRKKERELRRWKKKAARDRMAAEFIKGDIHYIVPVNPNNF